MSRALRTARWLGVAVVAVSSAACRKQSLALTNLPCEEQACTSGYVCHPQQNLCVPVIPIGCDSGGSTCPSTTQTGDACPSEGAFVACADNAVACESGCRTCQED